MENPFILNYGKEPINLIERDEELFKIQKTFTMKSPTYYSYLITGIRGAGKTVALTKIQEEFYKLKNWIVIDLTNTDDLLDSLAYSLSHCGLVNEKTTKAELSVSLTNIGISFQNDEKFLNSAIVIEEILKVLTKKNIRVLLCIDEVSNSESMRKLASNFQLWIRHNLDVFLLMTGVYENIENLLNDKVLTFLFRTPKIDLNMLNINIIADSYSKVLNIDFEKAEELANITRGYAFAYQVVGYYAYEQHSSNFLEFSSKVDSALLNGVYRKLWIDCKNNEKNILKAIAYEKNNNKEISDFTKIKINNLPKYKNKLISKKIISLNGSLIELTLPRFKEIILKGELK